MNTSSEWQGLVARVRKEAVDILGNSKDGAAIVAVCILMNNEGEPMLWIVPKGLLVEPRKRSLNILVKWLAGMIDAYENRT